MPTAPVSTTLAFFITCSKGIESLLEAELRGFGIAQIKPSVAGVYC